MLIKLTNASPQHADKPIVINSNAIISMRDGPVVREDGTVENVTFVFCPPHGTWEVKESITDIMKVLNKVTQSK